MVTPKTGRPRGRPTKPLLEDPDRYWITYAFALQAIGLSENKAFDLAAARVYGHVDKTEEILDGDLSGSVKISTSRVEGASTTITGKASTLRRKANVDRTQHETRWIILMTRAWLHVLASKSHERSRAELLALGKLLQEEAFVGGYLTSKLNEKYGLPDFSPRD